jgi:hypothetical protein
MADEMTLELTLPIIPPGRDYELDLYMRQINEVLRELGSQQSIKQYIATTNAYAGIKAEDNSTETAIAVAGTPVQVTIFDTNGPSSDGLTPDHTNDHITVDTAGIFMVAVSATVNSVVGAASRFEMTVMKNNGATGPIIPHIDRNVGGGGTESGVISMGPYPVALSLGDTVEVWIENETNTQNYVVEDISLSVKRIA